jgi:nucleotide-binding universal stress UspA family protein
MRYNKILLATDGSESSIKAAKKLAEMDYISNAKIEIFHAENHPISSQNVMLPYPALGANVFVPDAEYKSMRELFKKVGEKILVDTKKVFDDIGIPVETKLVFDISPEDYAIEAVKKEKYDLIVMGAKGHHGRLKNLIGSVCTKISNDADCDVLIVK